MSEISCADRELVVPAATAVAEWRWLGFKKDSPQNNMDFDRALFEELKSGATGPSLRFFAWSKPAVSYGRTQGVDAKTLADAVVQGLDAVRRPTGGGKVFHGSDLCFSIHWRKSDGTLPWKITESYLAIHRWIQASLNDLNVRTDLTGRKSGDNGWCFQSAVCYDILKDGEKIVGGAQWRDGHAAMHQGSIQLPLSENSMNAFRSRFEDAFNVRLKPSGSC